MNKQLITIRKNMSFERNLELYHQSFARYYKSTPKMRSWDRE